MQNNNIEKKYDVAFSFSGSDRDYVKKVKDECSKLGLKVFYDEDAKNEFWGKNFIEELLKIYGDKSRYVVPFISPDYFQSDIASAEFATATTKALKGEYILPVIIGDAEIPKHKLNPYIQYLKAEDYTISQLASEIYKKVKGISQTEQDPLPDDYSTLPTPKLIPPTFSKYQELDKTLKYLKKQFDQSIDKLQEKGLQGTVFLINSVIQIRVEDYGKTIFSMNIFPLTGLGEGSMGINFEQDNISTNAFSIYLQVFFDKLSNNSRWKLYDMGELRTDTDILSNEELFQALWTYIIKEIENRSDR